MSSFKQTIQRWVNIGVNSDMPASMMEEVLLLNAISIASLVYTAAFGLLGAYLFPEHFVLIVIVASAEIIAKSCVLLFHNLQRYLLARVTFTMATLGIFLTIIAYFGPQSNFQYLIITTFFTFLMIFKNGTRADLILALAYLVIGALGFFFLKQFNTQWIDLSHRDLTTGQNVALLMNVSLVLMVGVIYYYVQHWGRAQQAMKLKEVTGTANILNSISENMTDGIFKSDPDKGFVYVNKAFAEIYGYDSEQEILTKHPEVIYMSRNQRELIIQEIMTRGQILNKVVQYRKKDGATFYARLSCRLIEEEGNEYIVGTVTDITTQHRQAELLQKSEKRLREAQRIAQLGNWQMNVNSRMMQYSAQAARILGITTSNDDAGIYYQSFDEFIAQLEDVNATTIESVMAKSMITNDDVTFQSWATLPNGERKYLNFIARYSRGKSPGAGIWYGTVQDQTDQRIAEEQLRTTQKFFESVLDNIPIETVMFDQQLRYVYISKSAVPDPKLRRWLKGKTNTDYAKYRGLSPRFAEQRDEMIARVLKTGKPVQWEEEMTRPDGAPTYHLRLLYPLNLESPEGHETVILGYSFDLNEIKTAQIELQKSNEELRRLNRELDRFVYSISHDLRAPIASSLGLINLALESTDLNDIKNLLNMQEEALERLDVYIKDVLNYSRNKRLDVANEKLNVSEIVQQCLEDLKFFQKTDDLEIRIDVDRDLEVMSDPLRLKIIVNNLLSNAIKYRDHNKNRQWVQVSAFIRDGQLHIAIEDNGIGIKSEYLEKIWQMFFRGTSASDGSGLGLYILKETVDRQGGSVDVESKFGEGSRFEVKVPVSTPEASV
ncbi:MAG: hypothetical protein Kow0075_00310 [Salibacteraceae bacterium]